MTTINTERLMKIENRIDILESKFHVPRTETKIEQDDGVVCGYCNGNRQIKEGDCPNCFGKGYVPFQISEFHMMSGQAMFKCPVCQLFIQSGSIHVCPKPKEEPKMEGNWCHVCKNKREFINIKGNLTKPCPYCEDLYPKKEEPPMLNQITSTCPLCLGSKTVPGSDYFSSPAKCPHCNGLGSITKTLESTTIEDVKEKEVASSGSEKKDKLISKPGIIIKPGDSAVEAMTWVNNSLYEHLGASFVLAKQEGNRTYYDLVHKKEQRKLEIGDVVVYKSGGPKMTISSYNDDEDGFICWWYSSSRDEFKSETFNATSLVLVEE